MHRLLPDDNDTLYLAECFKSNENYFYENDELEAKI